MNKNNVALVLEGGGAKCAYQLGAILALEQAGFSFNILSGASFGALNSALYIEGGTQRMLEFYENLKLSDVLCDLELVEYGSNYKGDGSDYLQGLIKIITNKATLEYRKTGTEYYHNFLRRNIDETAIKNSNKEYYCSILRTENNPLVIGKILLHFSEHLDLLPLYQNNEIEGLIIDKNHSKLREFIVGSANYPTFSPLEIDGNYYLDGGIYDNAPYKHLIYKGIKDIVIIRTHPEPLDIDDPHILVLTPSKNIGHALHIEHNRIMNLINMGYQETKNKLEEFGLLNE